MQHMVHISVHVSIHPRYPDIISVSMSIKQINLPLFIHNTITEVILQFGTWVSFLLIRSLVSWLSVLQYKTPPSTELAVHLAYLNILALLALAPLYEVCRGKCPKWNPLKSSVSLICKLAQSMGRQTDILSWFDRHRKILAKAWKASGRRGGLWKMQNKEKTYIGLSHKPKMKTKYILSCFRSKEVDDIWLGCDCRFWICMMSSTKPGELVLRSHYSPYLSAPGQFF